MKKILSLLTALTLTASGVSTVISCNTKTVGKDQEAVNAVKKTIDNQSINVPNNTGLVLTAKQANANITNVLKSKFKNLKLDGITIAYAYKKKDGALIVGRQVDVTATITKNKAKTTASLKVTLDSLNDDIKAIKNAIDKQDITVVNEGKTHSGYSVEQFKSEIKTAITKKTDNIYNTSSYDITFKDATPIILNAITNQDVSIQIQMVKDKDIVANATIKLKLNFTKQSIANALDKLKSPNNLFYIKYNPNKPDKTFDSYKDVIKTEIISKLNLPKDANFTIIKGDSSSNDKFDFIKKSFTLKISDGVGTTYVKPKKALLWQERLFDNSNNLPALPNNSNVYGITNFKDNLYIYTNHGVYKATDNKNKFKAVNGIPTTSDITAIKANSDYLYVGTKSGKLYKSNTTGFTEVSYLKSGSSSQINSIYLGVGAGTEKNIIALGTENNGFYISNDGTTFVGKADNKKINSITSGANNDYWVATPNGVFEYKVASNSITITRINNISQQPVNYINYLGNPTNYYIYTQKDSNGKYQIYNIQNSSSSPVAYTLKDSQGTSITGLDSQPINFTIIQNTYFIFNTIDGKAYQTDIDSSTGAITGISQIKDNFFGLEASSKFRSIYVIPPKDPRTGVPLYFIITQKNKLFIG